jgi:hypothetical protein
MLDVSDTLDYFDTRDGQLLHDTCVWLQLLLVGLAEFDVEAWEQHAIYRTFTKKSKQVIWFWEVRMDVW